MGVRLAKLTGRRQVIARWIGDGRSGHNGGEQGLQGAGLQRAERSTIGRRADRHDELITPFVARDARVQLCKTFKAAVRVSRSLFVAAKPRSRQHSSAALLGLLCRTSSKSAATSNPAVVPSRT